jgi:integrase
MPEAKPVLSLINARLKADRVGVAIQQRGDRLALVATLPPKPGSPRTAPYQQRIALGIYASLAGLRQAERQARLLGEELACDAFDWSKWVDLDGAESPPVVTTGEWIDRFKEASGIDDWRFNARFLNRGGFKWLDRSAPLTDKAILEVVFRTASDTAFRYTYCQTLQRLAKFAGVDVDLSPHAGNYSSSKTKPKAIPDDVAIVAAIDAVKLPRWRYAIGLIAAYGLRPHEVFYLELEQIDGITIAKITEGKTGPRCPVFPVPEDWASRWHCPEGILLPTGKNHILEGKRIAKVWYRTHGKPLGWSLYGLRHAYAIRCHALGVPVAVAAQWMGHGPDIHLKTYNRWISEKHHLETYRRLILGKN